MDDYTLQLLAADEPYPYHIIAPEEQFWVDLQPFLLARGYRLRPRYDPKWKAPWMSDDNKPIPEKMNCEERLVNLRNVMDAVRIKDNSKVVLKRVETWKPEIPIATFLSSETNRKDPRNHTVPILDIILLPEDDGWAIVVMPMLIEFPRIPFRRVGEFAEAAIQYLHALEYMHENNIAHRDVCLTNLMMDCSKVIPKGFHFVPLWLTHDGVDTSHFNHRDRWSVRPVHYYLIDFDISVHLPEKNVVCRGIWGRDKMVPEMSKDTWYDPFKVDVYQLGHVFMDLVKKYEGLDKFTDLGKRMTDPNPETRPTAAEAAQQCEEIISKLSRRGLDRKSIFHPFGWMFERFLIVFCRWNTVLV